MRSASTEATAVPSEQRIGRSCYGQGEIGAARGSRRHHESDPASSGERAFPHEPIRQQAGARTRCTDVQSWCHMTFLRWRYPVAPVQRQVARPLEVESFDGSAWVGVTPFLLRRLRAESLPPLPWISQFPETNCRTYGKGPDGHSGVWFFSLGAARLSR